MRRKALRVSLLTNYTCNLKCKLCTQFCPKYIQPYHPSYEFLAKTIDKIFELADYGLFEMTGGEPLLRTDMTDIWEYIYENYFHNADRFGFITNGTIIPSEDLLKTWARFRTKLKCIVDDYGYLSMDDTEKQTTAERIAKMLTDNGIEVNLRKYYGAEPLYGGWFDYFTNTRIPNAKERYLRCHQAQKMKHCCGVVGGLVMPCQRMFGLNDSNVCIPQKHEYIDLFDDSETLDEKFMRMESWRDNNKLEFLSACEYCTGYDDVAPRYKPAEQYSEEEAKAAKTIERAKGNWY